MINMKADASADGTSSQMTPRNEVFAIPVVCIIVSHLAPDGTRRVLVQRRLRKTGRRPTDYPGLWELPQGKIRQGETIFEAAARELTEETGLQAQGFWSIHNVRHQCILASEMETIVPLVCSMDTTLNYLGIGVMVEASGLVQQTQEADDHRWVTWAEVKAFIQQGEVFPLNVPILRHFFAQEEQTI